VNILVRKRVSRLTVALMVCGMLAGVGTGVRTLYGEDGPACVDYACYDNEQCQRHKCPTCNPIDGAPDGHGRCLNVDIET
jgi:hypothetical protein